MKHLHRISFRWFGKKTDSLSLSRSLSLRLRGTTAILSVCHHGSGMMTRLVQTIFRRSDKGTLSDSAEALPSCLSVERLTIRSRWR